MASTDGKVCTTEKWDGQTLTYEQVEVCPAKTLMIGFAYSLDPDGSPGTYNKILALTVLNDLLLLSDGKEPLGQWVGIQWEIYEALKGFLAEFRGGGCKRGIGIKKVVCEFLAPPDKQLPEELSNRLEVLLKNKRRLGAFNLDDYVPDSHVAPPFEPIKADDVVDWKKFVEGLTVALPDKGDPAVQALAERIVEEAQKAGYGKDFGAESKTILEKALYSKEQIALYLNRIVTGDPDFLCKFWNGDVKILELQGLQKKDFGPVGFEERELPKSVNNLPKFQAQRVNRLIIDAVCSQRGILKEAEYLSTRGVLKRLFGQMDKERMEFDTVLIYASPVHSARCRRQLIEVAWDVGKDVELSKVHQIFWADDMPKSGWWWDPTTAQVWCRSQKNWEAYEEVTARLR